MKISSFTFLFVILWVFPVCDWNCLGRSGGAEQLLELNCSVRYNIVYLKVFYYLVHSMIQRTVQYSAPYNTVNMKIQYRVYYSVQ